jgi:hypothetical protein
MPEDQPQSDYEDQFGAPPEGSENEEDLAKPSLQRLNEAVVTGTDWTTETILRQLERGNIRLDPAFQRRDAWRAPRKSKFIESLILGLPVPQVVLAEDKAQRGRYLVIDGKQRLLSLRQFAASPHDDSGYEQLRLEGLQLRSDLNGKTLSDIESDSSLAGDVTAFQNQPIRTVVIKGWPNEDVLYLIFLRLNTGSVQLSPQELRQALHPGPFVSFVDEQSGQSIELRKIFKTSEPDFRMRDAELLVRYFAFRNFLDLYRGNLKTFLDDTCTALNKSWEEGESEIRQEAADLESAIEATFTIFGQKNAFRKWYRTFYESRFNRAIFDTMVYYFADENVRQRAVSAKDQIKATFQRLCDSDRNFSRSIESTTKSLGATASRLNIWGESLRELLHQPIRVPVLRDGRIQFTTETEPS